MIVNVDGDSYRRSKVESRMVIDHDLLLVRYVDAYGDGLWIPHAELSFSNGYAQSAFSYGSVSQSCKESKSGG